MPIYKGLSQNNPTDISVGGVPMQRVYVGDRLVWQKNVAPAIIAVKYGLMYNWWAATDIRNICAEGWVIPTRADFIILRDYLGGALVAGGAMKEDNPEYWYSNVGANNISGFNGRGSGIRNYTGAWNGFNVSMPMWTCDINSSTAGWQCAIRNYDAQFVVGAGSLKKNGMCLRPKKAETLLTHGQVGTYIGNDGKVYRTICIGTQEWLADNLCETLYRNGDSVSEVTDVSAWAALTSPAMCAFNNDWSNVLNAA